MEWEEYRHPEMLEVQLRLILEGRIGRPDGGDSGSAEWVEEKEEPFADGEFASICAAAHDCPPIPAHGARVFLRLVADLWVEATVVNRWMLPASEEDMRLTFVEIEPVRHPTWKRWVMWPDLASVVVEATLPPPLRVATQDEVDRRTPVDDAMTREIASMAAKYWALGGNAYFCTKTSETTWQPKFTLRRIMWDLARSKVG